MTLTRVVVDAEHFLALLADESSLVVPAISIFEVFKWILREHGEARDQQARLHTMDSDFRGIPDVEWLEAIS